MVLCCGGLSAPQDVDYGGGANAVDVPFPSPLYIDTLSKRTSPAALSHVEDGSLDRGYPAPGAPTDHDPPTTTRVAGAASSYASRAALRRRVAAADDIDVSLLSCHPVQTDSWRLTM